MKANQLLSMAQHLYLGIILAAALLFSQQAQAQYANISKDEMNKLSTWVGEWKGEGWQMDDQFQNKMSFTVEEKVESRLNGMSLIVEGKGMSGETMGHHALGMIYYNADKKQYDFHSLVARGQSTLAKGEFNDKGEFVWGFEVPKGKIQYTIKIDNDTWIESGAYSMDGNSWYPFMEMKLTRVK